MCRDMVLVAGLTASVCASGRAVQGRSSLLFVLGRISANVTPSVLPLRTRRWPHVKNLAKGYNGDFKCVCFWPCSARAFAIVLFLGRTSGNVPPVSCH